MTNASLKYKTESQRTWSTRTFGGGRRGTGWALSVSVSQKTILKENNRPLSIQPKIPEISNATDHVGLVRPENLGPALKVVLFDRSGYLSVGPKCFSPFVKIVVPSTAVLYPAFKNNNQTRGCLGRVFATGMYRSIGHVKSVSKFRTGIFVEWKTPLVLFHK